MQIYHSNDVFTILSNSLRCGQGSSPGIDRLRFVQRASCLLKCDTGHKTRNTEATSFNDPVISNSFLLRRCLTHICPFTRCQRRYQAKSSMRAY